MRCSHNTSANTTSGMLWREANRHRASVGSNSERRAGAWLPKKTS
jgi:hypothetical protein